MDEDAAEEEAEAEVITSATEPNSDKRGGNSLSKKAIFTDKVESSENSGCCERWRLGSSPLCADFGPVREKMANSEREAILEVFASCVNSHNNIDSNNNKASQVEPEAGEPKPICLPDQRQLLGIMQIVESAESKLQRQRIRHSRVSTLGGSERKKLLLKSPAFSQNTLNDEQLDRLAGSGSSSNSTSDSNSNSRDDRRQATHNVDQLSLNQLCGGRKLTQMANKEADGQQQKSPRSSSSSSCSSSSLSLLSEASSASSSQHHASDSSKQANMTNRLSQQMSGTSYNDYNLASSKKLNNLKELLASKEPSEDCDRDRGGPTPTNDLIRALIHRDRLALGSNSPASKSAGRRCSDVSSNSGSGPSSATSVTNGRKQQQQHPTTQQKSPKMSCPANETTQTSSSDNLTDQLLSSKCQHLQLSDESPSGHKRKPSMSPYRVAANAVKCMVTSREAPTELSHLGLTTMEQSRRHSTYMLPTLLNNNRLQNDDSASDNDAGDLEEGDHENGGQKNSHVRRRTSAKERANKLSLRSDCLQTQKRYRRSLPNQNQTTSTTGTDSSSSNASTTAIMMAPSKTSSARLPTSASSPSALSTPTNESRGCGGPCCSEQAQLNRLAADNASLGQRLFANPNPARREQRGPEASGRHSKIILEAGAAVSLSSSNSPRASGIKQWQAQRLNAGPTTAPSMIRPQRPRIGSNPLDRLRYSSDKSIRRPLAGGHTQSGGSGGAASSRKLSDSDGLRPTMTSAQHNANKRHSLINLISTAATGHGTGTGGGGGCHLVSRLSQPARTLLQTNRLGNQNAIKTQQHRASVEVAHLNSMSTSATSSVNHCDLQQQYDPLIPETGFKIVVMGASGSGKTSIIQRFLYDSFSERHSPTVEDTYFIEFPYKKSIINISITDTSGTYQFPAMKKLAMNSGDAFILVYNVDDPHSLDDLEQLRETILKEREQAYLEINASVISSDSLASSTTSGLSSASHSYSGTFNMSNQNTAPAPMNLLQPQQQVADNMAPNSRDVSPSRIWSLASQLFHYNHHANQQQTTAGQYQKSIAATNSSIGSSVSSSNCSSTDNSRRSSISAAEAALKTRRTRRPPMVIVANKYDLPEERHLIDSDEIEALAVIDWNNGFVRASASFNWNINEIFQQVLKQARQPPTLTEAIVSKRRKSLPPKLPAH